MWYQHRAGNINERADADRCGPAPGGLTSALQREILWHLKGLTAVTGNVVEMSPPMMRQRRPSSWAQSSRWTSCISWAGQEAPAGRYKPNCPGEGSCDSGTRFSGLLHPEPVASGSHAISAERPDRKPRSVIPIGRNRVLTPPNGTMVQSYVSQGAMIYCDDRHYVAAA
jgi:hypothetical protein